MVTVPQRGTAAAVVLPAAAVRRQALAWAAVLVVVALLYLPGMGGFFAGDDFNWLVNTVRTVRQPGLFLGSQSNFVRHGESLFFIIGYLVAGFSFPVYFAMALLIHLANVLLVGRLALRSGVGQTGAVLAALLWGVDYRHAEAVFRLYGVADPLALLFGLGALLLYIRGRWLAATPCLLAALFCKENAVVVPVVAVVWVLLFEGRERRGDRLLRTLPMFAAVALFVPLLVILRSGQSGYLNLSATALPRVFELVLSYVGPDVTYLQHEAAGAGGPLLPVWLAAVLLAAAVPAVWRIPARYRFGVLWTAITMLPTLFVPFQTSRYHYVPLVGVALVVGVAVTDLERRARAGRGRRWLWVGGVVFALYLAHAAWGLTVEERDYRLIGEFHRRAAESFRRDALPAMFSDPGRVSVFVREDTMVWADRLLAAYGGRPWYWPTTYKWIYRRPHGILGLTDTYGFVTYCAAVQGGVDQPLFVAASRDELATALADRRLLVIWHDAANRFGVAPPQAVDELARRDLSRGLLSALQPGRFEPE